MYRESIFLLFLITTTTAIECDSKYSCPDETTCCLLESGEYGCCPLKKAVCCDDQIHCCPHGSTCDSQEARCLQQDGFSSKAQKKLPAAKIPTDDVICPDKRSRCASGTTCCRLPNGQFGCCPAEQATCCADHLHCCPHNFRCDSTTQRCIDSKSGLTMRWLKKTATLRTHKKPAIDMLLPDEEASESPVACGFGKTCPAHSTCCSTARLGHVHHQCCPMQNAVCCGETCCPHGFQCVRGGKCQLEFGEDN